MNTASSLRIRNLQSGRGFAGARIRHLSFKDRETVIRKCKFRYYLFEIHGFPGYREEKYAKSGENYSITRKSFANFL
jgi:hypothetical protein